MNEPDFIPHVQSRWSAEQSLDRAESFCRLLCQRRSVRDFSDDPVPRTMIEFAIMTASSAPSGAHRQPWRFVAISDPTIKKAIRVAAEREEYSGYEGGRMSREWLDAVAPLGTKWQKPFLERVPWIVVVFEESYRVSPDGDREKHYYVKESVGIACGMFIAALHQMGLATLTHTPSPMNFLSKILDRPTNERPFMMFPIGYPAPDAMVPNLTRKTLSEVTTWVE